MEWIELDSRQYGLIFNTPATIFGSARFTDLNAAKVSRVMRLALNDSDKFRLGLTVGLRESGDYSAPFSAPFAAFDFNSAQSAEVFAEGTKAIRHQFPNLRLTLPPSVYDRDSMIQKTLCSSLSAGATIEYCDWNYHMELLSAEAYLKSLNRTHRKKLRIALDSSYRLLNTNSEPARAYEVIRKNRMHKGYPLRMSLEAVINTTGGENPVVDADFFVLTNGLDDAAAAMIYKDVVPGIAQVIYWGDSPDSVCQHPVNLLAFLLQTYYHEAGYRILDIGPSSEHGIPSVGLCEFKERIGCTTLPKFTLRF